MVARHAAGDSYPAEADEARAQIAACSDCAALAADIELLSRSMSKLPAPARPRDFRITPEQADRLRGSWFERAMRRFAGPGMGTLRPVAGVALSIGLVMAVAGSLPSFAPAGPATDLEVGFPSATQEVRAAAPDQSPALPLEGYGSHAPSTPAATAEIASGQEPPASTIQSTDNGGQSDGQRPGDASSSTLEPVTQKFDNVYGSPDTDAQRPQGGELDASPTNAGTVLTYGGILVALLSLGVLVFAGLARRRYADRLLR